MLSYLLHAGDMVTLLMTDAIFLILGHRHQPESNEIDFDEDSVQGRGYIEELYAIGLKQIALKLKDLGLVKQSLGSFAKLHIYGVT